MGCVPAGVLRWAAAVADGVVRRCGRIRVCCELQHQRWCGHRNQLVAGRAAGFRSLAAAAGMSLRCSTSTLAVSAVLSTVCGCRETVAPVGSGGCVPSCCGCVDRPAGGVIRHRLAANASQVRMAAQHRLGEVRSWSCCARRPALCWRAFRDQPAGGVRTPDAVAEVTQRTFGRRSGCVWRPGGDRYELATQRTTRNSSYVGNNSGTAGGGADVRS